MKILNLIFLLITSLASFADDTWLSSPEGKDFLQKIDAVVTNKNDGTSPVEMVGAVEKFLMQQKRSNLALQRHLAGNQVPLLQHIAARIKENRWPVNGDDSDRRRLPLTTLLDFGRPVFALKMLLLAGADPNKKDVTTADTALTLALKRYGPDTLVDVIKTLLAANADPNGQESVQNQTPLMLAAKAGNETVVRLLLEFFANVFAKDSSNNTVFAYVANNDAMRNALEDHAIATMITNLKMTGENPVNILKKLNELVANFNTSLFRANAAANTESANLAVLVKVGNALMANRVNVDARDNQQNTAFMLAAQLGARWLFPIFIGAHANADAENHDGSKVAHFIAESGDLEMLKVFLALKNERATNEQALRLASARGKLNLVEYLLGVGVKVNALSPILRRTALSYAAEYGRPEVVARLLRVPGIKVNRPDREKITPLIYAVRNGHKDVVSLLLDVNGIDVNRVDNHDYTALIWAANNDNCEIVKLLLDSQSLDLTINDQASGVEDVVTQGNTGRVIRDMVRKKSDPKKWMHLQIPPCPTK